ncbi:MAG TPA: division plane positioning ATPase MipZ [Gaiellaceae bacterium]|nr:division plane positioning ATPase MipZ [Gaiellaceae bacterium]
MGTHTHPAALKAVRVLRRGLWIIVLCTVAATALSVYLAKREPARYQASAQVLLKYDNIPIALSGLSGIGVYQDPDRFAATQTQIAMSPLVARRVAKKQPIPGLNEFAALGAISVTASTNTDLLSFTASWSSARDATLLANEYARQYVAYRRALDTNSLVSAREELERRIEELRAGNLRRSDLVQRLVEQEQQLRTLEALRTENAVVLREALGAFQTQPRPKRAGVLGFVLGLMLGVALAFVRDALDTRVKSSSEVGERLGLPLLARIPAPPRSLKGKRHLVMLSNRTGAAAEAFRMLRTNLDFVNLDRGARSIMVTSAFEQEGKSTTVANLAIAMMRAGHHVALVDLDLRRPTLGKFFGLPEDAPGITTVAAGKTELRKALRPVLGGDLDFGSTTRTGNGADPNGRGGSLTLLPAGATPPDPGEFIATAGLPALLRQLGEEFEFVLVDTPPLLSVGDAMALSGSTDAMVVVVRLGLVKRPALEELRRALHMCPTVKLGYVATGTELEEGYGYGGYEDSGYYGERHVSRSSEESHV